MALHLTLLMKLLIGAMMIGITTVIHATVCDFVFRFVENYGNKHRHSAGHLRKIMALVFSVFCIGFAIMIYIWLWTLLFYHLEGPVLKDFETALYFTTITFTTVGFGDVVLSPEWRLLSASTAINGMIMFGWSTAFIFEIMSTLYKPMDKK